MPFHESRTLPYPEQPALTSPYHTVVQSLAQDVLRTHREKYEQPHYIEKTFDEILALIDEQLITNLQQYEDPLTGAQTTFTSFEITAKIFSDIINHSTEISETDNKKIEILFGAFALPPDGHALGMQDVAISRIFDHLRRCIFRATRSEPIKPFKVVLIGSPYGFGGKVTDAWIKRIRSQGMAAYQNSYEPLLNALLDENDQKTNNSDDTTIIGISKGCVIADQVTQALPEDLQARIKRLYAIPVGHDAHQKRASLLFGFLRETLHHMRGPVMPKLMAAQPQFLEKLSELHPNLQPQPTLKALLAAVTEANAIMNTTPLQSEHRAYLQVGKRDPLRNQQDNNATDRHFSGEFDGRHYFYTLRIDRWLKTVQKITQLNATNRNADHAAQV